LLKFEYELLEVLRGFKRKNEGVSKIKTIFKNYRNKREVLENLHFECNRTSNVKISKLTSLQLASTTPPLEPSLKANNTNPC
jgi:hypothetical protein